MSKFGNVGFDPETLAILGGVLDEAWVSIQAQRNGNTTRAVLAERILNLAVKGERNPAPDSSPPHALSCRVQVAL